MTRKDIASAFLCMAASGQVLEAYEKYVHPDFSHHNPYFPGDRESLMKGMEQSAAEFPNKIYETVRSLEEGDLVAVHGRVRIKPGGPWIAVIHILRFDENLIIEEWEVAQEEPKNGPNVNGIF